MLIFSFQITTLIYLHILSRAKCTLPIAYDIEFLSESRQIAIVLKVSCSLFAGWNRVNYLRMLERLTTHYKLDLSTYNRFID